LDSLVNPHETLVCEKNLGQFTINVGEFMTQSTVIACGSYTWRGETYSASGTYYDTLSSIFGCDSILRLNLTINAPYNDVQNVTACESYTWNGTTYTSSQQVIRQLGFTRFGCDSIQTLNLTIGTPNSETATISACDSYTWIDGNTYTSSNNTATHILSNQYGCDSTVTLNLTINYSNTGVATITACNSYTWIDGNNYTSSNSTATHVLTNLAGCDSTVTLNLTLDYYNSTPTDLTTSNISLSSAQLSWTHPGAENMIIQYRKLGNVTWQVLTTTYADNYTLLPFTGQFAIASDYQWRIRVSCGGVYGAFSEIQTFSTPCKTAINLQASNITLSSASLTWTHPGGDAMIVEFRKLGNTKWQTTGEISYTTSHELESPLGSFSEATDYEWRIRVKCGSDWGSYSERAVFSTPCKTPLNLSANNISETDATISFTHPGGDNMLVEYRKLGNTKWQTSGEIAFATSHLLLPVTGQFSLNTTYEYRVRVKCGADWGSYSVIETFTTPNSSAMIVQNSSNEYSVITERTATSLETYPNPNKGDFTISSSHEGKFNIINELGQLIMFVEITKENNYKATIEGFAKGVYFVTGTVENEVLTQKVVVQ
jgi:hypothetical protein